MSEYHAAIGLAELDGWQQKRASFIRTAQYYRRAANHFGLEDRIWVSTEYVVPYSLCCASDEQEADNIMKSLQSSGIEYRLWYGKGIHSQKEFSRCPTSMDLSTTNHVAASTIGLPYSVDLSYDEVMSVVGAIALAVRA